MRAFDHAVWIALLDRDAVRRLAMVTGIVILTGAPITPAWAQYAIRSYVVAGGGGTGDIGGPYTLGGTIGQTVVGQMTGGGYSLGSGFWDGGGGGTAAIEPEAGDAAGAIPLVFRLYPTAPNPFVVGRTVVTFDLPQASAVRVLLYDVSGRLARTLVDGALPAGQHRQAWDGTSDDGHRVATGIYFLHVNTENVRAQQKLVVLK